MASDDSLALLNEYRACMRRHHGTEFPYCADEWDRAENAVRALLPPPDTVPVARADLRRVLDETDIGRWRRYATHGYAPQREDWRERIAAWERLDAAAREGEA